MSANWKNPFLNKEKINVQQQVDKDLADLDVKLDAELKKHSKNIYAKDMRYISTTDNDVLIRQLFFTYKNHFLSPIKKYHSTVNIRV